MRKQIADEWYASGRITFLNHHVDHFAGHEDDFLGLAAFEPFEDRFIAEYGILHHGFGSIYGQQ